jgi:hypothetical protein
LNIPTASYRFNPGASVTFSWTFSDPDSGDSQSAYQLQIGNSGFTTIYLDTGKVASSNTSTTRTLPSNMTVDVYYWRVKTWDSQNYEGAWSSGRAIIVDRIKVNSLTADKTRLDPGATVMLSVQLVYEYDGAYITSGNFTLNGLSLTYSGANGVWNATDSKSTVQSVIYNNVTGTEGTYGLATVNMNGKSLTVIWDTPPSALPTSPSEGTIFNPSVSITFSWTFSDNDAGDSQSAYRLQIGNSNFTTIYVDTGKVTSSADSATLTGPSMPGTCYWRVMVWDSFDVNGSWSAVLTFKVNAPPNVALVSPDAGTLVVPRVNYTFTWAFNDPDAGDVQSAFRLQIDDDPDFWTPNIDTGKVVGSRTNTTILLPSTSSPYYWRVMVWDNHDLAGSWSSGRLIIVGYRYILNGPYYENGTKTSFAVTVTAYFEQIQVDQFSLNGTVEKLYDVKPTVFVFNFGAASRSWYVPRQRGKHNCFCSKRYGKPVHFHDTRLRWHNRQQHIFPSGQLHKHRFRNHDNYEG